MFIEAGREPGGVAFRADTVSRIHGGTLTGRESASIIELPPETHVKVAALPSEIGSQILEHYREPNPPVS